MVLSTLPANQNPPQGQVRPGGRQRPRRRDPGLHRPGRTTPGGLRELVRHRHKLVQVRTTQKASRHAVLGKCGEIPALGDLFGPGGTKLLDSLRLPEPYASLVAPQRRLLLMLEVCDLRHRRLRTP